MNIWSNVICVVLANQLTVFLMWVHTKNRLTIGGSGGNVLGISIGTGSK